MYAGRAGASSSARTIVADPNPAAIRQAAIANASRRMGTPLMGCPPSVVLGGPPAARSPRGDRRSGRMQRLCPWVGDEWNTPRTPLGIDSSRDFDRRQRKRGAMRRDLHSRDAASASNLSNRPGEGRGRRTTGEGAAAQSTLPCPRPRWGPGSRAMTRKAHELHDADGKSTRDAPWIFRTYAGHTNVRASNELYRGNLSRGQTGLSIAFDLPTQCGYSSDHPLAGPEIGKVGVPVNSLDDFGVLFEGLPIEDINTSMTINATAMWLLSLYVALAEERGGGPRRPPGRA